MSMAYIVVNDRLVGQTTTDDPAFVDPENVEAELPWSIHLSGSFVWDDWFAALANGTEVVRQWTTEEGETVSLKRYTK